MRTLGGCFAILATPRGGGPPVGEPPGWLSAGQGDGVGDEGFEVCRCQAGLAQEGGLPGP